MAGKARVKRHLHGRVGAPIPRRQEHGGPGLAATNDAARRRTLTEAHRDRATTTPTTKD